MENHQKIIDFFYNLYVGGNDLSDDTNKRHYGACGEFEQFMHCLVESQGVDIHGVHILSTSGSYTTKNIAAVGLSPSSESWYGEHDFSEWFSGFGWHQRAFEWSGTTSGDAVMVEFFLPTFSYYKCLFSSKLV